MFGEDKKIFSELLLIIGGFALAETLIRKFLELSEGKLPWYILPLLAFLVIMTGVELREGFKRRFSDYLGTSFLLVSIVLLVLTMNNIINIWWFVGVSIFGGMISLVLMVLSWSNKIR